MAPDPALTLSYLNYLILTTVPTIFCQALILCEALRVLPGEVRMCARIYKRKRINIAEILFFMIKYIALLAFICEAITDFTSGWLTPRGCLVLTWIYEGGLYFTSTLVSSTLAWRCYVIFQRRHRVGVYLLIGLSTQLSMAMLTASAQLKYSQISEGYCVASDHDVAIISSQPWYKKRGVWFLLYSFLFDGSLVTFASWRLIKCVRGPSGLQRISKLLFLNNVHFLCIVSFANLIEFIIFVFFSNKIPSLLPLTVVVEVILGMQLLISEQDAAHGYGKTWVSGGTTRNTTFPTSMPRTSQATSSHWTETKRGGNTSSATSTQQQQTTSTFSNATRGISGGGHGLDGIRYDCTEEVLVDYDMTMTQLAPKEEHGAAEEGHDLTDFGPYQGGQTLDGVRRTQILRENTARSHHSNSSTTALNRSPTTAPSSSPLSANRARTTSNGGGVSIRDIRAKVSSGNENHEDMPTSLPAAIVPRSPFDPGHSSGHGYGFGSTDNGYDTRALGNDAYNSAYQAAGPISPPRSASGDPTSRPGLKKSGSISSFSTCTCSNRERESISYGAALSSPAEAAQMNINVVQHTDRNSIEEVIPVNPDAPFAEYQRPSGGNTSPYAQNSSGSGSNSHSNSNSNNPYSNNPYAGRGGY